MTFTMATHPSFYLLIISNKKLGHGLTIKEIKIKLFESARSEFASCIDERAQ